MGKYVNVASLCCTPETNIIVYVHYERPRRAKPPLPAMRRHAESFPQGAPRRKAGTLLSLRPPASRPGGNKFLLFTNYPACGISLQQPKETMTNTREDQAGDRKDEAR